MSIAAAADVETPERNNCVRPVSLGVLGLMIVWNCAGWIVDKGPFTFEGAFLTLLTAGLMALGVNASAQLRRAFARVETPAVLQARRFWQVVVVSSSLWSAGSAHHAYGVLVANDVAWALSLEALWAVLNAAPLLVVLTLAAFFEPFLFWAIETVESSERKRPGVAAETPPATDASTAASSSRRPRNGLARAVARDLARQSPKGAANDQTPVSRQVSGRGPPLTEDDIKRAIATLTKRGELVSFRNVAKAHGDHIGEEVPVSRVERSAGRHLLLRAA